LIAFPTLGGNEPNHQSATANIKLFQLVPTFQSIDAEAMK